MPLYEYVCETCHGEFEVRRTFSDVGVPPCPNCNGTGNVRRKFSPPAIVFKGSGFYVTDSRGKNSSVLPAGKKESSDSAAAPSAESSAKSESSSE